MKQGWKKISFEDSIVKVKYTTKIPSNDYLKQGLYPIVSQEEGLISGYWDNANDVFKVSTPVVIFGDHTRILKYVDFDFVLGADGVKILQPIKSIDAKFFKLYLESCKIPSLGYSRHYKLLKELQVPIPPREEQERIVAELDCMSGVIEKKREQLKQLDALAQSIFFQMFGDPITNEKGWEVKKLGDIATSQIGITYKPENVSDNNDGTIVLRSSNIQESTLCFDDIVRVKCDIKANKYVQDGDILMCSRNGSFRLVGKVAMIANLPEPITYGAFMTIIRSPYQAYLFAFFKSPAFRSQLTTSQTATINQITVKMLNEIKVALPPMELQQEFADKIEAIEKQKELIKQSITQTEELFNSRMDYYFN